MATSVGNPVDMSAYIDTTTQQAFKNWKNQEDQMQWAKDQFAKNQGTADKAQAGAWKAQDNDFRASDAAFGIQGKALDTADKFGRYSDTDRALYENTYVPAMKEQMDFARGYTTPDRMAANRAGAMSQQNIAFDANADAAKRQLQSVGVDPSSGRFAGLDAGLQAARAKAAASAGTTSDRQTEMLGQQYLANAIQTGAVLPGQVANEAGVGLAAGNLGLSAGNAAVNANNAALGAGNAAVNTGLATTASGSATMGTPLQWNAQGNDMIKQWLPAQLGATQLGLTQNKDTAMENLEQQKINAAGSSGIGAALGAGSGILGGVLKGAGGLGGVGNILGGGSGGVSAASPGSLGGTGAGGAFQVSDLNSSGGFGDLSGGLARRGGLIHRFADGGRVGRYAGGGSVFDLFKGIGGASGEPWDEGGAIGDMGGDGGGLGFSPMGYISDFAQLGTEIGGGDQGPTDSPQTPMDPLANVWDTAYGKPREKYDEGERIGSDVGRPIGRAIGDYFTGGIGSGAFAEGFGRLGGGIGAMVQGHFGEGINDLTQGTPLSFIKFQEGGDVPTDDQVTPEVSNMVQPEQSPSGGAETDDVHALLNEGEFVMPKDVSSWLGEKFLQNIINKARTEMAGPKAEPEESNVPQQAMALSPPSFMSEGARTGGMI